MPQPMADPVGRTPGCCPPVSHGDKCVAGSWGWDQHRAQVSLHPSEGLFILPRVSGRAAPPGKDNAGPMHLMRTSQAGRT